MLSQTTHLELLFRWSIFPKNLPHSLPPYELSTFWKYCVAFVFSPIWAWLGTSAIAWQVKTCYLTVRTIVHRRSFRFVQRFRQTANRALLLRDESQILSWKGSNWQANPLLQGLYAFWQYDVCDVFIELVKPVIQQKESSSAIEAEKTAFRETLWLCLDSGLRQAFTLPWFALMFLLLTCSNTNLALNMMISCQGVCTLTVIQPGMKHTLAFKHVAWRLLDYW